MQMDTTTQQNAALVEEAAAASRAIVEQTHSLAALVARYRVAETAGNQPVDVRHSADDDGDIESAAA
jgi:methyl-accepting chemotaxis protein